MSTNPTMAPQWALTDPTATRQWIDYLARHAARAQMTLTEYECLSGPDAADWDGSDRGDALGDKAVTLANQLGEVAALAAALVAILSDCYLADAMEPIGEMANSIHQASTATWALLWVRS